MYPRIFLAIDNCFASKRYTRPVDWMCITRDMGVYQIEASADTECDPLYMGPEYMARWRAEVARVADETGQTVRNLYSGHGQMCIRDRRNLAHARRHVRLLRRVVSRLQRAQHVGRIDYAVCIAQAREVPVRRRLAVGLLQVHYRRVRSQLAQPMLDRAVGVLLSLIHI